MDEKSAYIFGRNAILEALQNDRNSIEKIFVTFGASGESINKIFSLAKRKNVLCVRQDNRKFITLERSVTPKGANTQGVIALMKMVKTIELGDLIKFSLKKKDKPVIIVLDGINDPHNLGAIARTAECSGVSGIILSDKESVPITPTAIKISSGALEHLQTAKVKNFEEAFKILKSHGFLIIGTDMQGEQVYSDFDFNQPLVIVIGSEGQGLSKTTLEHCDALLRIPILGKVDSLNASVSAAVVLYEIVRQRNLRK